MLLWQTSQHDDSKNNTDSIRRHKRTRRGGEAIISSVNNYSQYIYKYINIHFIYTHTQYTHTRMYDGFALFWKKNKKQKHW